MAWTNTVHVLDNNYLAITFLISLAIQSIAFIISYSLQFDKITDFSGGSNFFLLALITFLLGQNFQARNWIVTFSVLIWSIRLAGFLLFRVLKRGKDDRFDQMRSNFFRFGAFWLFQLVWVWLVSLPIIVLNSPNLSSGPENTRSFKLASDWIGLIFWFLGLVIETSADIDKYLFKAKGSDSDQDGLKICRAGLWSWSRHPNYFGEILLWWGIWLMAIGSAHNLEIPESSQRLLYATVISPIFITILLMFLSGLPTAEKPVQESVFIKSIRSKSTNKSTHEPSSQQQQYQQVPSSSFTKPHQDHEDQEDMWKTYQNYLNETSILIPIPKSLYVKIPIFIKNTILFDWPIYRFDENSDRAKEILIQESIHNHS